MNDKKIAMLDDQSPINKELKYAFLTFNKMTKEQKKQLLIKRKVVMKNGKMGLKELELLVYLKKYSRRKISKMTKCDTHTKIGVSSDGKYDCYFSTNSESEIKLLNEFKKLRFKL